MRINLHILTLLFNVNLITSDNIDNRSGFYNKILNLYRSNGENVHIKPLEDKLSLVTKKNQSAEEKILRIPKDYVISSCAYFPYKDEIVKLLQNFVVRQSVQMKEIIFQFYSLVYHLLYQKNADKVKIRNQFRDNYVYSSPFFKFDFNKEQKEYFDMINQVERYGNNSLYFTKEQIDLVGKLNLDNMLYETTNKIFKYISKSVSNMPNDDKKRNLKTFIDDYDNYIKYFDYIFRYSFQLSAVDYLSLYNGTISESEFISYQNDLSQFEYPSHTCLILSPLLDLVDFSILTQGPGQFLSLSPLNGKELLLVLGTNVTESTIITREVNENMSDDRLLLDYGIVKENNPYHYMKVNVDFDMNQLGSKKMQICLRYKCEGLDLLRYSPKVSSVTHEFLIKEDQLNLGLLSIAKLFALPEDDLDVEFHAISFAARKILGPNTEIRGVTKYFQFLSDAEPKELSYWDILKANMSQLGDVIKNKLFQIGLKNTKILLANYDYGLDYMYKVLLNDIKKKKTLLLRE